jgi:protoporphyrinogen oxidase
VSILGGGLAGLFAAYHLKSAGVPVTVYEERDRIGGNSVTFRCGDFYLDSGAHRFHDKDKTATSALKDLLGEGLQKTTAPSQVYSDGRLVDFPLSALGLIRSLGVVGFARSTYQIARSRLQNGNERGRDLEQYATRTYGSSIAGHFLLNYSEKLWGIPAGRLSPVMAKARLKGFSVGSLLKDALAGATTKNTLPEGSFYYPSRGIGAIADRLGDLIGADDIRSNSRVTGILHDGHRILSIIVNGRHRYDPDEVISTIPLPQFVRLMDPPPREDILEHARTLKYRNLVLVAFFLRKESVSANATIYFPDSDIIFTRAYEPRNRSRRMAPAGQTSLVLEVPCDPGDTCWSMPDDEIARLVLSHLSPTGWVKPDDIIDTWVGRMEHAYPVVGVETGGTAVEILGYLEDFENLRISGRNGRFAYCSIHDIMRESSEIAERFAAVSGAGAGTAGPPVRR